MENYAKISYSVTLYQGFCRNEHPFHLKFTKLGDNSHIRNLWIEFLIEVKFSLTFNFKYEG